jgi:hypothetical protein
VKAWQWLVERLTAGRQSESIATRDWRGLLLPSRSASLMKLFLHLLKRAEARKSLFIVGQRIAGERKCLGGRGREADPPVLPRE